MDADIGEVEKNILGEACSFNKSQLQLCSFSSRLVGTSSEKRAINLRKMKEYKLDDLYTEYLQ